MAVQLTTMQRAYYGQRYEIAFLRKNSMEFQQFFQRMMSYRHGEQFQTVKPHGSKGDLKCDGYLRPDTIFQVYAPYGFSESALKSKITEDFEGAIEHWDSMEHWVFVHNGKDGLPAHAIQLIEELEKDNSPKKLSIWGESELRGIVFELELHQLESLFGFVPTVETFDGLEFDGIEKVIDNLIKAKPDPLGPLTAPSPEKINANELSDERMDLLRIGRRREKVVGDYFDALSTPKEGDEIAEAIRQKYQQLKAEAVPSNQIFDELHEWVGGNDKDVQRQAASLSILSYFFERCDIFEDADEAES